MKSCNQCKMGVYKMTRNAREEVERYKTYWQSKATHHRPGIDNDEVVVPFSRLEIIRVVISLTPQNKWNIYQNGCKIAFFIGYLEEEGIGGWDIHFLRRIHLIKRVLRNLRFQITSH